MRRSGRSTPPPSSSTSACRGWTAGTSWARSRPTRATAVRHRWWSCRCCRTGAAASPSALGLPREAGGERGSAGALVGGRALDRDHGDATGDVVVVDDDPAALELVRAILEPPAGRSTTCHGRAEALSSSAAVNPSVVLVDLLMPRLDGFAVIDALRADPHTADIPMVVLTAKSLTADDRARLRAGSSSSRRRARSTSAARRPAGPDRRRRSGRTGGRHDGHSGPARRGQRAEPQAGKGRARVRRFHRPRGHDGRGGGPTAAQRPLRISSSWTSSCRASTATRRFAAARRRADRQHPRRRAHGLRDAAGPGRAPCRRLRRLPREADQRAPLPRPGARASARTEVSRERPRRLGPRRRRPAAEPQADGRRADAPRLHGAHGRLRRGGPRALATAACPTSSCSTS